jgi:hypothetical protein
LVAAKGDDQQSCGVCGRTILAGETTRDYISRDGETIGVCQLCKSRAEVSGWTRADIPRRPAPAPTPRRRREGVREVGRKLLSREPQESDEGASSPERRVRRALDGFNETDQPRKVAGLTRSLGEPRVAAVPTGTPTEGGVRITVAWELAWYQWEARVTDAGLTVRELGSGDEVEQLAEVDRAWNARAEDSGALRYGVTA